MAGNCGNFWNRILSDVDGGTSSKRFITIIAFVLLSIAFLSDMFFDIKLQEFVWDGMLYLVLGGLGFTTLEKFSVNRNRNRNRNRNSDQ